MEIRKRNFVILILVLVNFFVLPGYSVSQFEERTDPYFWGTKDSIMAHNLIVGEYYGALVGSNQAKTEQQWINFTSESSRVQIWFLQASAEYTNETVKIQQLFIDLYKIDDNFDTTPVYVDRLALNIIYKDEQVDFGNISTNIIWIFVTAIMIVAFGGFIYAITKSKRFK